EDERSGRGFCGPVGVVGLGENASCDDWGDRLRVGGVELFGESADGFGDREAAWAAFGIGLLRQQADCGCYDSRGLLGKLRDDVAGAVVGSEVNDLSEVGVVDAFLCASGLQVQEIGSGVVDSGGFDLS